ncbi:MAG TPA: hypothetical protein VFP65_10640, partial [Anaeromyxobacteraceae bacterium]|nr:hypothetical protein [Anaeromyxobacteraceae bacterium]
ASTLFPDGPTLPLNGVALVRAEGGDFLYVNDNGAPNTVSAFRVDGAGGVSHVTSYPTGGSSGFVPGAGLVAAPTVAAHGRRLLVLNPSARGPAPAPASVSSFDVLPDGSLAPVPGSPFDLGTASASIALDPTGAVLYAGGAAGDVVKLAVGPDGALTPVAHAAVAGAAGKPNGLAVDPTGRWLAFTTPGRGDLVVLDAATLAPIDGGVLSDVFLPSPAANPPWIAAGVVFDAQGRLFVGHTGGYPVVSAYRVLAPDTAPPVVTILAPAAGVVSGEVEVSATAEDLHLASLGCSAGGVPLGSTTLPAFSAALSTLAFLDGPLTVSCAASDQAGNRGTASVDVAVKNWTERLVPARLSLASQGRVVTLAVTGPNVALLAGIVHRLALAPPGGGLAPALGLTGDGEEGGAPPGTIRIAFDRRTLDALLRAAVAAGAVDPALEVTLALVDRLDVRVLGSATATLVP